MRWCTLGRGSRGARWLVALLAWGALVALALPRLQGPSGAQRGARPAPSARLLLQSEPGAPSTPSTSSTPPPAPPPSHVLGEEELRAEAARRLPSLPLDYWYRHKDDKDKFYKSKECAPLPNPLELEFHNVYWQTLHTANGTFHLYGAYLDDREASLLGPAVRLLAVHDRVHPKPQTHCQLWFEERAAPVLVRTLEYKYVWNSKWGNYRDGVLQPYLIACVLPADVRQLVPAAVSLVERPCDRARTALRVHHDRPPPPPVDAPAPPPRIAVCVKGLDFLHEDLSIRLVEWIEFVLLLGAEKVYFYELQVHPNMSRVLQHYAARGLVEVTPITLPGGQPNLPALQHLYLKKKTTHKRQMELVPYNDCLYRHMHRYRWIALLDIDEVIVPLADRDWGSLLRRILPLAARPANLPPRSSYHAANLYYLDSLRHEHEWVPGVPRYMHMLQHVWRTRNFTRPGQYVKAFHETGRVLALHNHFPLACLGGACSSYELETRHARLQHYRADCVTALSKTCADLRADPVRDSVLLRWQEPLVARVTDALRQLNMLPSS
ncbi:hypothetical protein EVAR_56045_1 [Eumeta japonica]|uniref:Glycosyltransferase family 92 protein n=1 Tax=Eumeta variegata TaxID=151549 RepID=A0A4C1Y7K4_EUMVA|nr:hypothetical protein EVAR_56045_1 [Eumeta japonica]